MTRARRTSALVTAAVLSVSACGGDGDAPAASPPAAAAPAASGTPLAPGPTDDAAEIVELARSVVTAQTVGDMCRMKFSAKFVTTVFGSVAKCEDAWNPDDPANRTRDAKVSDVTVSGLAATARVTEVGGEWDGASGFWGFIRTDDGWRVAAWGVDYLRGAMRASFSPAHRRAQPGNLLGDAEVLTCLSNKLQRMDDPAFTRFVYGVFRSSDRSDNIIKDAMVACSLVRGKDGLTPLRRAFEVGVRRGAERGGMPHLADCVARRLRTEITDEELTRAQDRFVAKGTWPGHLRSRVNDVSLACTFAGSPS